jgi:hypothetical protein
LPSARTIVSPALTLPRADASALSLLTLMVAAGATAAAALKTDTAKAIP